MNRIERWRASIVEAFALSRNSAAPEGPGDPRRIIRNGMLVAILFLGVLVVWAALARLDAAIYAPGTIVVTGDRKAVQHRDGGIVRRVLVKDGDRVRAGQPVVELAVDELRASERSLSSQVIGLQATQARLQAEIENRAFIVFPASFARLQGVDRENADQAMILERREFMLRAAARRSEKEILTQRTLQLQDQINGYTAQLTSNRRQAQLIEEELRGIRALAARGYYPLSKLREVERQAAALQGDGGQYEAQIAQTRQSIGETRVQALSLDKAAAAESASQYRAVGLQLDDLTPRLAAIQQQIARAVIRAPTAGVVLSSTVFTDGGVISPGQVLMQIVPQNTPLVIAAQVGVRDADDLRPGQRAEVRVSAFHGRGLPLLSGVITKVSADRLVDEATRAPYYAATVSVPLKEIEALRRAPGGGELRPGMPVQVVVPVRKRTILDYIVEPLSESLWKSFREQ